MFFQQTVQASFKELCDYYSINTANALRSFDIKVRRLPKLKYTLEGAVMKSIIRGLNGAKAPWIKLISKTNALQAQSNGPSSKKMTSTLRSIVSRSHYLEPLSPL
jgi:hypothetical protein